MISNPISTQGRRIEAISGKNITLTIDINIQSIAYHQLNEAIKENNAKAGSIIVIEPKSGDILALVNYPSFDPSNRKNLMDMSKLRNRATIDIFEPGSVLPKINEPCSNLPLNSVPEVFEKRKK